MIAVADDDVVDSHRDADSSDALDLRTADLDGIALSDIILDRGCQPRRRNVEIDRARAQTQP